MKKIVVSNLPESATEASVTTLFSEFGTVRSIRIMSDIFTGRCRGIGFVEMEGHEARTAISGLDGKSVDGNMLKVRLEDNRRKGRSRGRR